MCDYSKQTSVRRCFEEQPCKNEICIPSLLNYLSFALAIDLAKPLGIKTVHCTSFFIRLDLARKRG